MGTAIAATRLRCAKASARPKGSVWVGRGSRWANPFAAKITGGESGLATASRQLLVNDFRAWLLTECWVDTRSGKLARVGHSPAAGQPLDGHLGIPFDGRPSLDEIRTELAGRDLACHCHIGQPCHAELLIEIATGAYARGHVVTALALTQPDWDDHNEARTQAADTETAACTDGQSEAPAHFLRPGPLPVRHRFPDHVLEEYEADEGDPPWTPDDAA